MDYKLTYDILNNINNPKDLKKLSLNELNNLPAELRGFLLSCVSQSGGHLASNLGVVELTTALHYVFNAPDDKIIWDIGHQAYIHKILTGRKGLMTKLSQDGGAVAFTSIEESKYDVLNGGHSSNSISIALGILEARKNLATNNKVIPIIGDASITSGMALEALNNITKEHKNLCIILNHNDMSISKNVGILSSYFSQLKLSMKNSEIHKKGKYYLKKMPALVQKMAHSVPILLEDSNYNFFNHFGLHYYGPINGHNINDLVNILSLVKNNTIQGPCILHIVTTKGKGYIPAETSKVQYHALGSFDISSGSVKSSNKNQGISAPNFVANYVFHLAKKNQDIIAITPAMLEGSGLVEFSQVLPKQIYDVGIAEQHSVSFAAGLALENKKPFVFIYSAFLQRSVDQIINDVILQDIPMIICVDRAGPGGRAGPCNSGIHDMNFCLGALDKVKIASITNQQTAMQVVNAALNSKKVFFIRYSKEQLMKDSYSAYKENNDEFTVIKKANNKKILIIAHGDSIHDAHLAMEHLANKENIEVSLIEGFMFPIASEQDFIKHIKGFEHIILINDHTFGAFVSYMQNLCIDHDITNSTKLHSMYIHDCNLKYSSVDEQKDMNHMSSRSIIQKCIDIYKA